MRGVTEICRTAGVGIAALDHIYHGTTIATNAALQYRGARAGHDHDARLPRHRAHRPSPAPAALFAAAEDSVAVAAARAAPAPQGRDRAARAAARPGRVAARRAAGACRRRSSSRRRASQSIAVCFLFSYINPEHERRAKAIVQRTLPGRVRDLFARGLAAVPRVRAVHDHGDERLHRSAGARLRRRGWRAG